MRARTRLLVLGVLGSACVAGALAYATRLAAPPPDLSGALRGGLGVTVPTGPANQVALTLIARAVTQNLDTDPVPADVHTAIRRAPWGIGMPVREVFDEALAAAAAACGPGLPPATWLNKVEYFGGLPLGPTADIARWGANPFYLTSIFGVAGVAGTAQLLVLAVEPAECATDRPRLAVAYSGAVGQVDAETEAMVARSRVFSNHGRAFLRNDIAALIPLADHADPVVRREVLQAMVRSGRPEAVEHVRRLRADPNDEIRFLALLGLAELGDRTVEPDLRALLGQDDPFLQYGMVHYRAVLALGQLGFADVRPELEVMADWHTADLFPQEARAVLKALPTPHG